MTDQHEVLVHVSASASRQNDDLYRSFAQAYLQFEPLEVNADSVPVAHGNSNATISKDSYGSFPSLLDSAHPSSSHGHTDTQHSSFLDEDLNPTSRLSRLEQIHERWRTTARPSLMRRSSSGAPPAPLLPDDAFIDDTQLAYQAIESQVLEDLSPTSEDTSVDESEMHESLPRTDTNIQAKSSTALPNFAVIPYEIFPPAPPITIQDPKRLPSQITEYLKTLKRENPHSFAAKTKLRALQADERGCWVLDTRPWPCHLQLELWNSLVDHVGSGRFGWGVTLHRESLRPSELGVLRLYCWGEVAEHMWLALWLCFQGKISGARSVWVDAEEEVVIEVQQ